MGGSHHGKLVRIVKADMMLQVGLVYACYRPSPLQVL